MKRPIQLTVVIDTSSTTITTRTTNFPSKYYCIVTFCINKLLIDCDKILLFSIVC